MLALWKRSKYEVWPSVLLTVLAIFLFRGHAPIGPGDTIGFPLFLLLAWLFSLDAVLDYRRTHLVAQIGIVIWFCLLTFVLPFVLYDAFTTRAWSNR